MILSANRIKAVIGTAIVAAFCLAGRSAYSDIIYLRNGQRQMGLITLDRADLPTISLRTSQGEVAIPRDKIERVQQEPKQQGLARIADQYLDKKAYPQAVDFYTQALELDKTNADIQAKFQEAQAGLREMAGAKLELDLAAVDLKIEEARALARNGKFEDAVKLLKGITVPADSPKAAVLQSALGEMYFHWGTSRLDHQDFPAAADKLKMAIKLDPTNQKARQNLARVWEGDPTRLDDLIEFYRDSTLPEDQLRVADALFRQRKYEQALPIYLNFINEPKFATDVMRERIRVMYDALHRRLAEQGDFAKALETYRAFLEVSPQEDPSPIARYEYMIKRSQTPADNADARAELAAYAEERSLFVTAKEEYRNVLKMQPKNVGALGGLRRFAAAEMQDAQDLFREGQYLMSVQKAREVSLGYPELPEVQKAAQELQAKAEIEEQKVSRNKQQQAVQLAARGDDYYNQAVGYLSAMVSKNVDPNVRVISFKQEAIKYLGRALIAWRTALQMDPSLGEPSSYDLRTKISDASQRYAFLTDPRPPQLPFRDLNRIGRGETSEGSR